MKNESSSLSPSKLEDWWTWNMSSLDDDGSFSNSLAEEAVDNVLDGRRRDGELEWILESISIFSSFSSNKSFSSLTSPSKDRTLSSNDSVYPRGKARRLNLSLVLHSKPTFAHCVQHGVMPSQRIFLLRHRSQAWAILLCAAVPTLMTFIGSIPGIFAISSEVYYIVPLMKSTCWKNCR